VKVCRTRPYAAHAVCGKKPVGGDGSAHGVCRILDAVGPPAHFLVIDCYFFASSRASTSLAAASWS
jgi:hypothetical protein